MPRDRQRKEDARICGTARLFTLCPAYIKHALLLRLEQKGKQCHQVKFLRIPQTPLQTYPSPYQTKAGRDTKSSLANFCYWLCYLFIQIMSFLIKNVLFETPINIHSVYILCSLNLCDSMKTQVHLPPEDEHDALLTSCSDSYWRYIRKQRESLLPFELSCQNLAPTLV